MIFLDIFVLCRKNIVFSIFLVFSVFLLNFCDVSVFSVSPNQSNWVSKMQFFFTFWGATRRGTSSSDTPCPHKRGVPRHFGHWLYSTSGESSPGSTPAQGCDTLTLAGFKPTTFWSWSMFRSLRPPCSPYNPPYTPSPPPPRNFYTRAKFTVMPFFSSF